MKYPQNLHTHTTYCDGKNTPEELIEEAIKKGMSSLGFSGHSYTFFDKDNCMSPEATEKYKEEILYLKEKYKGIIDIFLGIEYDMLSATEKNGFDYSIGSMHYLKFGNEYIDIDEKLPFVKATINKYFNGNGMKLAKRYYEELSHLSEYGDFDIIGHFDVIAKNCELEMLFDIKSDEYIEYALSAMDKLCKYIPYFEVNTGVIPRGYKLSPFPDEILLDEFKKRNCKPIISSDCHKKEFLNANFDMALELLKKHGFSQVYVLSKKGFVPLEIE